MYSTGLDSASWWIADSVLWGETLRPRPSSVRGNQTHRSRRALEEGQANFSFSSEVDQWKKPPREHNRPSVSRRPHRAPGAGNCGLGVSAGAGNGAGKEQGAQGRSAALLVSESPSFKWDRQRDSSLFWEALEIAVFPRNGHSTSRDGSSNCLWNPKHHTVKSLWRSRLASSAVNQEVAGSNPPKDGVSDF